MLGEQRHLRQRFLAAPPSVASVVAAVLEPLVAALCLVVLHLLHHRPLGPAPVTLLVLTLVLMFPGINRFGRTGVGVFLDIMLSWFGVVAVLLLAGYVTRSIDLFPVDLLYAWVVITPVLQWACVALGTRIIRERQAQQHDPVVIVGAGPQGLRMAQVLADRPDLGRRLVGIFDDRSANRFNLPKGLVLAGTLAQLPEFIERHGVKDVYITLPLLKQERIQRLMAALQNTTASLHLVPDVFGLNIIQGRLEDLGGLPIVGLTLTPFTGLNGMLKRGSDVVLAGLILLLIAPLLAVVAIGVRLSSPGPVIFRQRRTGLDGEIIEVYKFRSMTVQENGAEVRQATRDDPRVTRFGAFIRRTSVDELPQFINVLQGRMSIVGPRPHAVAHNLAYREYVAAYMARHKVKPGITGWAQVNGCRGEISAVEDISRRVEYDLEYLRNWSLALDFLIIARTIRLVFKDQRAY